jgi:hypothetical protein
VPPAVKANNFREVKRRMKVRIQFYKLTVTGANGAAEFRFNHAGHCEQVLRGFVHSGHEVTIKEVTEIKEVTQEELAVLRDEGVNFFVFDEPKLSRNEVMAVTCQPAGCR